MQQLPAGLRRRFGPLPGLRDGGGLACPAETATLHSLLRCSPDEGLRRAAYQASQRQPGANLAVLDALVQVGS